MSIFNLFITYGDTFLPSPTCYDELYYEIIRVHQIFDNLYSMGEFILMGAVVIGPLSVKLFSVWDNLYDNHVMIQVRALHSVPRTRIFVPPKAKQDDWEDFFALFSALRYSSSTNGTDNKHNKHSANTLAGGLVNIR